MDTQNYKNHTRFSPLFHYVAVPLSFIVLIGSINNLIRSSEDYVYSASLLVVVAILIILTLLVARTSALKAQDRAIKVEENFRHYLLTGKPLANELAMLQIIALRFASDDEFPDLAKKAVDENLSGKEIKKLIKNWRGDYYRV